MDEGDLVRSGITALWLKKLNFDCYVLDVKQEEIKNLNFKNNKEYKSQTAQKLTLDELKNMRNFLIFDIRVSTDFCKSRLKQSTWLNRCNIKDYNNLIEKKIILVSDHLQKLNLILKDLNIKFPDIDTKVYYWDEQDKDKFSEYFDTNEIQMKKDFVDFNFHTYLRHNGNKEHSTQYLNWETGLLDRMDEEETSFFKYF